MKKWVKLVPFLLLFFLVIGVFLLYKLRFTTQKQPLFTGELPQIEVENNYPFLDISLDSNEVFELSEKTGFLREGKYILDVNTAEEYRPKTIAFSFEKTPPSNPGYIQKFEAGGNEIYAYSVEVTKESFKVKFYLGEDYFNTLDSEEADSSLEGLLAKAFLYLGKVHQKGARLSQKEQMDVYDDLNNYLGKYDLVYVEKI